jgi:VanZ family protein
VQRVELGEVVLAALVVGGGVAVLSLLVRLVRRGRGRRPVLGAALLDGAIAASLAAVLVATLSPLELLGTRLDRPSEVNLRPLEAMRGAPDFYAHINVALLVPTILLLAQRWRRAGIVRLTLVGFLLSVGIEALQLVHPIRGTNVDDVALNTAGALAAAILGVAIRYTRHGSSRGPRPPAPPRGGTDRSDRRVTGAARSR